MPEAAASGESGAALRAAPSAFGDSVRRVLASLGPGEVVTYGEVAREAGFPGAARAVGALLAASDDSLPWWRVVTSSGRLVPGLEAEHTRRLQREGVGLSEGRVRPRHPRAAGRQPGLAALPGGERSGSLS